MYEGFVAPGSVWALRDPTIRYSGLVVLILLLVINTNCRMSEKTETAHSSTQSEKSDDVNAIHRRAITIDMHADTPQRLLDEQVDLAQRLSDGHFDSVRAREGGLDVILGGNIGEPPLLHLDQATEKTVFVLELSSYQLEPLRCSPHIAVLLNIVPEHLDYHASFAEYASAKENITTFQSESDFLVYNSDFPVPSAIAKRTRARGVPFSVKRALDFGCYLEDERIVFADGQTKREILRTSDIPLMGAFNVQNVCAAVAAVAIAGGSTESMADSVRSFKPLPHRLEYIGEYRGIRFYNDSISTVPESALSALEALGDEVQTLILGGHERHLDYVDFARGLLGSKVENLILFSPTGDRMWQAVESAGEGSCQLKAFPVETMAEAVRVAFEKSARGRICLLSPASPSYGKFKDYRERGDVFSKLVKETGDR